METKTPEPYLEPVSKGVCEVVDCTSVATYRASWAQGVIIRLLCATHKSELEGTSFGDVEFRMKRRH
jgi:hypothetical protein